MARSTTQAPAVHLGDPRNPIIVRHEGDRTIIEFDHTFRAPETTGKGNRRIASSLGNKEVITPDGASFIIGLNAYAQG